MTTYYVDGNSGNDAGDGSSDRPWKSLKQAAAQAKSGDEVRIRTATYNEPLAIRTANSTWKADTGHKPVLDGRYHDGLFTKDRKLPRPNSDSAFVPGDEWEPMVSLRAEGVTVDGLTIQNVAGTGVVLNDSRCVLRNCRIDFTYGSAIVTSPAAYIDGVVIENNVCTRSSLRFYDPDRSRWQSPESVVGVIRIGRVRDAVVRNNVFAYGNGEGINIDKGSIRTLVEGNVIHTCYHTQLYINRGIDAIVRNNLIYHLGRPAEFVRSDGNTPSGITIGDELGDSLAAPYSSGWQIYNNVVVGTGALLEVRNNTANYNTQLNNCYIGYNTFIGTSGTYVGIRIAGNLQGRPHQSSLVENNIVYNARQIGVGTGDLTGITFRNNLWGDQPVSVMRGPDDRIGNPNLVNVAAELSGEYPNPGSNIDPRNYQLTPQSTLAIGRASNGSKIGNLTPPAIRKDFYGGNRDKEPDIGAHEYLGEASQLAANFSIGPGQGAGTAPHTVDFTDKSTGTNPIVGWAWEFGDGQTSTETNPSHTYAAAGTFDVALTVTDDANNKNKIVQAALITVVPQPEVIIPGSFRRFVLVRVDNRKVLAYGTQYPDMRCVLIWAEQPFHILNYADIGDVERSTLKAKETELLWIDLGDADQQPMGNLEEETVMG